MHAKTNHGEMRENVMPPQPSSDRGEWKMKRTSNERRKMVPRVCRNKGERWRPERVGRIVWGLCSTVRLAASHKHSKGRSWSKVWSGKDRFSLARYLRLCYHAVAAGLHTRVVCISYSESTPCRTQMDISRARSAQSH